MANPLPGAFQFLNKYLGKAISCDSFAAAVKCQPESFH